MQLELFDFERLRKLSRDYDGAWRWLYPSECEVCGIVTWVPKCTLQIRKYCSKNCRAIGERVRVVVRCAHCGKEFQRTPKKIARSKSGLSFCSRKCKETSQELGGIAELQLPHYGTANGIDCYRAKGFKHHGEMCARCGYALDSRMLDVHHRDGDRSNNHRDNLEVVCVWCHMLETRGAPVHEWNGNLWADGEELGSSPDLQSGKGGSIPPRST